MTDDDKLFEYLAWKIAEGDRLLNQKERQRLRGLAKRRKVDAETLFMQMHDFCCLKRTGHLDPILHPETAHA